MNEIIEEIKNCLGFIKKFNFEKIEKILKESKKVFIAGTGRSELVGKMFAMRLRQIGYESYVVGETITPPAIKNDIVIFISYSGERISHIEIAKRVKKEGVKVLLISSSKGKKKLSKISDFNIEIPAKKSVQLGNSLFEQCVFIFLESFIHYIKKKKKISEENFRKRHTNLE
ncbi:SIS domain-containing protein [bacterium]|nr:SIS domain-containing protein [bacterium]